MAWKTSTGQRIAALREERAMTQVELAKKAGISPSTLSLIEGDRVERPHLVTIRKISRALGVEPQQLKRDTPAQAVRLLTDTNPERASDAVFSEREGPPTAEEWARLVAELKTLMRDVQDLQRGVTNGEVSEGFALQRVVEDVETLKGVLA